MKKNLRRVAAAVLLMGSMASAAYSAANIQIIDDSGQTISLPAPAQRIISLAPYTTEMLFAIGAGEHIVGTVQYADYPEAAKKIPRVGDSALLDLERVLSLKPNLIVAWRNGSSSALLSKLRALAIPIYFSEPDRLADVPDALRRLGRIAATESIAETAALSFGTRLTQLRTRYADRPKVTVFYQVWSKPLMTINGRQQISDVIALCGGSNIFAGLKTLVPSVSTESVVSANPEAIVTVNENPEGEDGLDVWRKFPSVLAVRRGNLIVLNTDILALQVPRLLDGAEALCRELEKVRARREPRKPAQ